MDTCFFGLVADRFPDDADSPPQLKDEIFQMDQLFQRITNQLTIGGNQMIPKIFMPKLTPRMKRALRKESSSSPAACRTYSTRYIAIMCMFCMCRFDSRHLQRDPPTRQSRFAVQEPEEIQTSRLAPQSPNNTTNEAIPKARRGKLPLSLKK